MPALSVQSAYFNVHVTVIDDTAPVLHAYVGTQPDLANDKYAMHFSC